MERIRSFKGETDLTPSQVLAEAVRYFGPGGLGLQIIEQTAAGVHFVGGGGYIRVETMTTAQEKTTRIEFRTGEWDYHAKRFLEEI